MSVKIRLQRLGRKNRAFYRIVATDESHKRNGKVAEYLGYFDPQTQPHTVKIDDKKLKNWLSQGAHPPDAVRKLLSL